MHESETRSQKVVFIRHFTFLTTYTGVFRSNEHILLSIINLPNYESFILSTCFWGLNKQGLAMNIIRFLFYQLLSSITYCRKTNCFGFYLPWMTEKIFQKWALFKLCNTVDSLLPYLYCYQLLLHYQLHCYSHNNRLWPQPLMFTCDCGVTGSWTSVNRTPIHYTQ